MISVLLLIVVLLGILLGLLGVIGLFAPTQLVGAVNAFWTHPRSLYLAVALRLVFGIILVFVASQTRFPLAVKIIGLLSLAGAIALPVIGRRKLLRLVNWWTSCSAPVIRLWALVAVLFSMFLVYACI